MKKLIGLSFGWLYKGFYKLRFGGRVRIGRGFVCNWRFKIKGKGKVVIGDDCNFWAHDRSTQIYTYSSEALVEIGSKCRLNGCILMARKGIEVGDHVMMGSANVLDNDFHSLDYKERRKDIEGVSNAMVEAFAVKIGDDVWVAGEVIVLKGVEIGDRAVVGTRAVVTKSVESDTVAVGNPARPVKSIKF
jgi:maltose O-acetyltransferase